MDRNYIVELIKDSRLQEALKALEKASQGSHLHNDVIAISAAYSEYTRQNRSATEDFQTLEIQRAKITNSLLSILDEISPEDLESIKANAHTIAPPPPAASFNKMYLYGIIGFLALVILFFVFSGGDTVDVTASTEQPTQTMPQQNNETGNPNTQPTSNIQDVSFVDYRIDGNKIGIFEQHGATWTENNTVRTFTFKEEKRADDIIYLYDASRGMHIHLDLHDKKVLMCTDKDPTPKMLYAIVEFGRLD